MKIYFNSTFIEKERITDDNWVMGNNGNKIEAYFEDLDLSNVNVILRLVIGWSNGETTNELPMLKSYNNKYAFINLPELIHDGNTQFTIKIYQNETLLQTAIFTRNIKETVNANDKTNITSAEYQTILNQLKNVDDKANNNNALIVDLQEEIENIKGDIESDDNVSNEDLQDLTQRVSNNETSIDNLQSRVFTLEQNQDSNDNNASNAYLKSVEYNIQTGIFTFTKQDGSIFEVDLAIEKVVTNFEYNEETQSLELTLADGTVQSIPMSDFINAYEGVENDFIQVVVQSGNKIQAILKDSSITLNKLSDEVRNKLSKTFIQEVSTISSDSWVALSESAPYTYQAVITLSNLSSTTTSIELINNQAILFANYGFAIGGLSDNTVIMYSVGQPTTDVTLTFEMEV